MVNWYQVQLKDAWIVEADSKREAIGMVDDILVSIEDRLEAKVVNHVVTENDFS